MHSLFLLSVLKCTYIPHDLYFCFPELESVHRIQRVWRIHKRYLRSKMDAFQRHIDTIQFEGKPNSVSRIAPSFGRQPLGHIAVLCPASIGQCVCYSTDANNGVTWHHGICVGGRSNIKITIRSMYSKPVPADIKEKTWNADGIDEEHLYVLDMQKCDGCYKVELRSLEQFVGNCPYVWQMNYGNRSDKNSLLSNCLQNAWTQYIDGTSYNREFNNCIEFALRCILPLPITVVGDIANVELSNEEKDQFTQMLGMHS